MVILTVLIVLNFVKKITVRYSVFDKNVGSHFSRESIPFVKNFAWIESKLETLLRIQFTQCVQFSALVITLSILFINHLFSIRDMKNISRIRRHGYPLSRHALSLAVYDCSRSIKHFHTLSNEPGPFNYPEKLSSIQQKCMLGAALTHASLETVETLGRRTNCTKEGF